MARKHCSHCELVRINGMVCHESGCPLAYRDEERECLECGTTFTPDVRHQRCCCEECAAVYAGLVMERSILEDQVDFGY